MNSRTLVTTCAMLSLSFRALGQEPPPIGAITDRVLRSVKMYIGSIACEGVVSSKDIAALVPYKTAGERDTAKYAVLWSGDIGCMGGSGSIQNHIAVVSIAPNGKFVVDPRLSSPSAKFNGFPSRARPKVVGNTADSIVLDGNDYDPDGQDAMCCPSIPVRITTRVDINGNWSVADRKVLRPRIDAQPITPHDLSRQAAPGR